MKLSEYIKTVEEKEFEIVELKEGEELVGYHVTYSFAGKQLNEEISTRGLSKKSTKKKLEELKSKLKAKIKYVKEAVVLVPNPGTDIIQNDYARRIFPHGFTTDCTTLSPKEVLDVVKIAALADPIVLKTFINQAQDAMTTFEKLGQMNRVDDLKIRISICQNALEISDVRNQVQHPA